jgi:hypothetical protein
MQALLEGPNVAVMGTPPDIDVALGLVRQETDDHHRQDRRIDLQEQAEQDRRAGKRYQDEVERRLIRAEALDPGAAMAPPIERADRYPGRQQEDSR